MLSIRELSPEVLAEVNGIVRSAVLEYWVLDAEAKVKAHIAAEVKSSIIAGAKDEAQVIESHVRDMVKGVVQSNAPSKVSSLIICFCFSHNRSVLFYTFPLNLLACSDGFGTELLNFKHVVALPKPEVKVWQLAVRGVCFVKNAAAYQRQACWC